MSMVKNKHVKHPHPPRTGSTPLTCGYHGAVVVTPVLCLVQGRVGAGFDGVRPSVPHTDLPFNLRTLYDITNTLISMRFLNKAAFRQHCTGEVAIDPGSTPAGFRVFLSGPDPELQICEKLDPDSLLISAVAGVCVVIA